MESILQQAINNFDLSDVMLVSALIGQTLLIVFIFKVKLVFRRRADWQ